MGNWISVIFANLAHCWFLNIESDGQIVESCRPASSFFLGCRVGYFPFSPLRAGIERSWHATDHEFPFLLPVVIASVNVYTRENVVSAHNRKKCTQKLTFSQSEKFPFSRLISFPQIIFFCPLFLIPLTPLSPSRCGAQKISIIFSCSPPLPPSRHFYGGITTQTWCYYSVPEREGRKNGHEFPHVGATLDSEAFKKK